MSIFENVKNKFKKDKKEPVQKIGSFCFYMRSLKYWSVGEVGYHATLSKMAAFNSDIN